MAAHLGISLNGSIYPSQFLLQIVTRQKCGKFQDCKVNNYARHCDYLSSCYILSLAQMDEMIAGIREVFVNNLQDLSWMDDETRKSAEEKVSFNLISGTVTTSCKIMTIISFC